jgi:hypothetical protein
VAFAGLMTGMGFLLVALMVGQVQKGARALTPGALETAIEPAASESKADEESDPSRRAADLPGAAPTRHVPAYPARFLEGCSAGDLDGIEEALTRSIGRGAPLFNGGDVAGCDDEYEETAAKLEASVAPSCKGPVHALGEGRAAAKKLPLRAERAWAMRDAFDGLLEVIERSRSGGVDSL